MNQIQIEVFKDGIDITKNNVCYSVSWEDFIAQQHKAQKFKQALWDYMMEPTQRNQKLFHISNPSAVNGHPSVDSFTWLATHLGADEYLDKWGKKSKVKKCQELEKILDTLLPPHIDRFRFFWFCITEYWVERLLSLCIIDASPIHQAMCHALVKSEYMTEDMTQEYLLKGCLGLYNQTLHEILCLFYAVVMNSEESDVWQKYIDPKEINQVLCLLMDERPEDFRELVNECKLSKEMDS